MKNTITRATFGDIKKQVPAEPVKIKYCLYARKSTESEERQVLSIDSQIKEMMQLAEREGLDIVEIKRGLADVVVAALSPIQKRYQTLTETNVKSVLKKGQKAATKIANTTLAEAKKKTGFLAG